jgi:iron complex transport system permease protein
MLGSVSIPLSEILDLSGTNEIIIFKYRLPHAITAVFAGIILSLCGLLMQSLFRNPLAGPFVLGVSSGASLMVALVFLTGFSGVLTGLGLSISAIIGALGVVFLISLISLRFSDNFTLLIFGLMLGYVFSALQGLIEYFGEARSLKSFVVWGMGSFGKLSQWWEFLLLGAIALGLLIFSLVNSRKMDFYSLGDDYATLEGIKVKKLKITVLVMVGVAAGLVTGFCGPIAFLGIAVPHLAAMLIKTKKHSPWIIFTTLIGAIVALSCDIIAEVPGQNITLPINVITCVIGAPVVIWVLLKSKRRI